MKDMAYVGKCKCGSIRAAVVDYGDKDTAQAVAEFIRDGFVVDRLPCKEFNFEPCQCGRQQKLFEPTSQQ